MRNTVCWIDLLLNVTIKSWRWFYSCACGFVRNKMKQQKSADLYEMSESFTIGLLVCEMEQSCDAISYISSNNYHRVRKAGRPVTSTFITSRSYDKNVTSTCMTKMGCAVWGCHYERTPLLRCSNKSLIIAAIGPDSITECILFCQTVHTYLRWLFTGLLGIFGAVVVNGLEVRGPFSVLPVSWQPLLKPQPQSAPAEKRLATRPHSAPTVPGLMLL